jgi:hypothetical protein
MTINNDGVEWSIQPHKESLTIIIERNKHIF